MNNIPQIKIVSDLNMSSSKLVKPKRDWIILLIILITLICCAIGFDAYMYKHIVSGDMYVSLRSDELVIENLKADSLSKILNTFETKKTKTMNARMENSVDPSL